MKPPTFPTLQHRQADFKVPKAFRFVLKDPPACVCKVGTEGAVMLLLLLLRFFIGIGCLLAQALVLAPTCGDLLYS